MLGTPVGVTILPIFQKRQNKINVSHAFNIPKQNGALDMSNNSNRKYKKPKRNTVGTTNPQASKKYKKNDERKNTTLQPRCPLLAKDSEWLDGLQVPSIDTSKSIDNASEEEEVLQLVECEDGPEMKPLTIMFPGLLEKDPQTLQDMLNKTMSTTELTRHLLGQKADFSLMKKVNRLIPSDKKWLETLSEGSSSLTSELHHGSKNSNSRNESDTRNENTESDSSTRKSKTDIASAPHASTSEFY